MISFSTMHSQRDESPTVIGIHWYQMDARCGTVFFSPSPTTTSFFPLQPPPFFWGGSEGIFFECRFQCTSVQAIRFQFFEKFPANIDEVAIWLFVKPCVSLVVKSMSNRPLHSGVHVASFMFLYSSVPILTCTQKKSTNSATPQPLGFVTSDPSRHF